MRHKILVLVINYGTKQRAHCEAMLSNLNSMHGYNFDIKVFSTENTNLKGCEEIVSTKRLGVDFGNTLYDYLPTVNLDSYDYVFLTENDHLYTQKNFDTFFKYNNTEDMAIGFIQYEEKDSLKYLVGCAYYKSKDTFDGRFGIVEYADDGKLFRFENCHQASCLIKSARVKRFLKDPPMPSQVQWVDGRINPITLEWNISRFYYSEKFPGSKNGVKKFIPLCDIENLLVKHLPNNYINAYGTTLPLDVLLSERDRRQN